MSELRRYLGHFRGHAPALVAATVLLAVAAAVPGIAVWMLQRALDQVLIGGDSAALGLLAMGFAGLYLVSGVISVLRVRITKGIAWRVTADLRRRLHGHSLSLSPRQQRSTGERLASLTSEIDEVQYGVSALVTIIRNPLTLVVLAGSAVMLAPTLAPWALLLLPAVLVPTWWGGQRLRARGRELRRARSLLTSLAQDQLIGLRTVQAFTAEERELSAFTRLNELDRAARTRMEIERILPRAMVQLVAACAVAVLLWFGGQEVLEGALQPGQLLGFAVALGLMSGPISGLSEVWALLQRSLAALERVYATLDLPLEREEPPDAIELPPGPLTAAWVGVRLDYGEGPVLGGVDLHVAAGEFLALVGATGAGKSSLLSLLCGENRPSAGGVRLGGVAVGACSPRALRRRIGLVDQRGFLFARTIGENLRLGCPDAPDHALREAMQSAGASRLADALDVPLDELGNRLSGGERQRICLARALLFQGGLLLLDEPTNQVDAQTQHDIVGALRELRGRCTIILVAHDLAVARVADRIAVLEDGLIAQVGTHEQLVASGGQYAQMWSAGHLADAGPA